MVPGDVYDRDLSRAGVVLKTLAFSETMPSSVGAAEEVIGHVKTDRAVGDSPVSFNVWSSDTNIVRVGTSPGQSVLTLTIGSGEADAAFAVCGVTPGHADLYVQRVSDYENNSTLGVTNSIRRAVTVTPPPLHSWSEVAGTLTGGGLYKVYRCETDAGGVSILCDGGGAGAVFHFISERGVTFTNLSLSVSNGATVVVEDLNIDNRSVQGASAVCATDGHPENTLALIGRNVVWAGRMAAGVKVQAHAGRTNALTIVSGAGTNGTLTAMGGVMAAGIGGDPFVAGGSVSFCGHAVVTALGGDYGAGVGGGLDAAGGRVEVSGQAFLLATGGRDARDVGPGAYCAIAAEVRLTGGLILSGSGVAGVSGFATALQHSVSAGVFDPTGWYSLSRNGGPESGRLYVAAPSIGVHSVSNVTLAGVYSLASLNGGGTVTFEIVRTGPVVPAGVHGDAAYYEPWLQKYGLASADLSVLEPAAFDAAWLLDQNPQGFVSGALAISGVQVGEGTIRGYYTLQAVTDGGVRTVTHLNGRLVVLGTGALTGSFVEIAEITDSVGTGTYAFEIPYLAGARFIKIAVDFP
jgi:hypothetical protein